MKIINFSDLEDWTGKQKSKMISKNINIDNNLVNKVGKLFEEYYLIITDVSAGKYCDRWNILLPSENNLIEYRVKIDGMNIEKEDEDDNDTIKYDRTEFSIFLPNSSYSFEELKKLALNNASIYLKKLNNTIPEVIKLNINEYYDALHHYPENFKKFININNIKINNDNLEIINNINYRLYKDCKFLYILKDSISEHVYNEFIKDWIKLI
jgi:hypothetical protein